MLKHPILLAAVAGLVLALAGTGNAGIVFSDDFESPNVTTAEGGGGGTGGTSNKADTNKWVRASQGYGANANGLIDEGYTPTEFTDPTGEQAYGFRYTNSGVTSAASVIGALTTGLTYTVSFDVVMDGYNNTTGYQADLMAWNPGARRDDVRSDFGTVLARASGNATTDGNYTAITFSYATGDKLYGGATFDPNLLGRDVTLRFKGATSSAIIDNMAMDVIPEPATLALLALGGVGLVLGRKRR